MKATATFLLISVKYCITGRFNITKIDPTFEIYLSYSINRNILQHRVRELTDSLQHLVLPRHQLVLDHQLLDQLLVERLDEGGVPGDNVVELVEVGLDKVLPAELVVPGPVRVEGLGGGGRGHHPGGGGVPQELVVGLGQEFTAVIGDPLASCHPPGQDLVEVGVQSGAGELEPLVGQQVGAAGARHQVERERARGLAPGQTRPKPVHVRLLRDLDSYKVTVDS